LKSESEFGKPENTGSSDTVSMSVWHGGGMCCTEYCCSSRWLFVELFMLKAVKWVSLCYSGRCNLK